MAPSNERTRYTFRSVVNGLYVHRGFAAGVYTTNSPEACHYVLESAGCQIVVVENDTQLKKILQIRDRLPELRSIIQYKGEPPEDCLDVLTVSFFIHFAVIQCSALNLYSAKVIIVPHRKI